MMKINKYLCVLLVFLMCLGLWSCSTPQAAQTEDGLFPIKGADYALLRQDGESFLVFDDLKQYEENENDSSAGNAILTPTLWYSSVKEFKDTVTQGKLSAKDKELIAHWFQKDENGKVLTCDFNRLHEPLLPEGNSATYEVAWQGGSKYSLKTKLEIGRCYLHVLPLDKYQDYYRREFVDQTSLGMTSTETIDGKTVIYFTYSYAKGKRITYTLSEGDKTVHVRKEYILAETRRAPLASSATSPSSTTPYNTPAPASTVPYSTTVPHSTAPIYYPSPTASIPCQIDLYCTEGNVQYVVHITLSDDATFDPTDEWLMQIGLKEYQETESKLVTK